jgi:DNA-directed RNA polymerase subunit RPC12/RpoP
MQENPEIQRENIKRHLCENCGANMIFDPKIGKLACPYCASAKTIETNVEKIVERDFYSALRPENQRLQKMATDAMQVSCDSCGATVVFIPPESARQCDFCGAKLVAQPKSSDPLVAPESVIPFTITNNQAISNLKNWTNSRWFAPNELKTMAQHDKAESIYLPYWTFDANTETRYTGQRGEDYQVRENYTDSQGKQQVRTRTETNWYHASGNTSRFFDDVPVPATKSVLPKYLERLNWDFSALVSYEPAYLSGHKAQVYQVSLEEGFERFKQIAEGVIRGDVHRSIGGDRQRIHTIDTQYSDVTFKHLLVPVYAGAYRFNNKVYQIVINGKTGEVQGERPYSWLKIGCLVVFILIILLIFVSIAGLMR